MNRPPDALVECRNCGAIIDFSTPQPDDARLLCGKCGNDIGRYGDVKAAAKRAVQFAALDAVKDPIKH